MSFSANSSIIAERIILLERMKLLYSFIFSPLFEPIQIGNVELKNRIAMSPMNMGYTGPMGFASEQTNAWYATRARGGFGLIITECNVWKTFFSKLTQSVISLVIWD